MVEFWVTRSPAHPKYPGGAWHFWADSLDSPPRARRLIGPNSQGGCTDGTDDDGRYTPDSGTLRAVRVQIESEHIWEIISEDEAVRIVLGGLT